MHSAMHRLQHGDCPRAHQRTGCLPRRLAAAALFVLRLAPADVSAYRMLATNYQPVFQKNSALVAEELAAARRELRDAELEAEALGLRSHRGNAAVRSLKKMIASPASRGNSGKGGSKAGAGLGVLNLGALFRGGSAELSGEKKKQPRASEAPGKAVAAQCSQFKCSPTASPAYATLVANASSPVGVSLSAECGQVEFRGFPHPLGRSGLLSDWGDDGGSPTITRPVRLPDGSLLMSIAMSPADEAKRNDKVTDCMILVIVPHVVAAAADDDADAADDYDAG